MGVQELPIESVKDLPTTAGVYWVLAGESVLYVGQSANLRHRWAAHHRIVDMHRFFADRIRWISVERERLLAVELEHINEFRPVLNGRPVSRMALEHLPAIADIYGMSAGELATLLLGASESEKASSVDA